MGKDLVDLILPGEHSITDTTLIRHFAANDPLNVTFESSRLFISIVIITLRMPFWIYLMSLFILFIKAFNPYGEHFDFEDF